MYNRAVRLHQCVYEALNRLIWHQFEPWVASNHPTMYSVVSTLQESITDLTAGLNQQKHDKVLNSQALKQVYELWTLFLDFLRCNNGQLSAFWMSYIQLVDVLLALIRASREGNWHLHLHAIREMIPWCFAYDKVNYARYLSAYYAQMISLEKEHPNVYQQFMDGHFTVQLGDERSFSRIPVDQATEVTVNKDTKTPGGVTKYSLKTSAVNRYYVTAEYRCSFLGQLRDFVQVKRSSAHHDDLHEPRIAKDEKSVASVQSLIESWNNLFDQSQELSSISTAQKVPLNVANDLMRARQVGERAYQQLKTERIESSTPKTKFHDPLELNKLKTFASLAKQKTVNSNGRALILKADRSLFGRMMIIGQSGKIEVRELLCHSLGPLPWALATPEGFPRKTNKENFASHLQKDVQLAEQLPQHSATVTDGMSLVQKINIGTNQSTFSQVAPLLLSRVLTEGSGSNRIDVVFDTFQENSIKDAERRMRGEDLSFQVASITAHKLYDNGGTSLLKSETRQASSNFWQKNGRDNDTERNLNGKTLYVTCECQCWKITEEGSEEVPELISCQEEANTRLYFTLNMPQTMVMLQL